MKRKILLIASEFPPGPGGIGEHAYQLALALHYRGVSLKVLTPADYATRKEVRQFDARLPFPICRFARPGILLTQLARILLIGWHIGFQGYKSLILTGKFPLWMNGLFKTIYGQRINTLSVIHGSEVNYAHPFTRRLTQWGIRKSDRLVAVSRYTKELLNRHVGLATDSIDVIPNGLGSTDLKEAERGMVVLHGYPRLLTVGHVTPRKGQHRVIKALPAILQVFPDVHYHIVGLPHDRAKLEALARSLGVFDRVTFHGRVAAREDLFGYYRACEIFMLLSENQANGDVEGYGIVALEANRCGKPVIGAKGCGVEDAVDDGRSGILVDGDDHNTIVEGVARCLKDPEGFERHARDWAASHRWDCLVMSYMELLP